MTREAVSDTNAITLTETNNYEDSLKKLLQTVQKDDITMANIINVITRSVEVVETYNTLTGLEKKQMALKLTIMVVKEMKTDKETESAIIDFTNSIGPSLIDTIILVSKGKLAINVKKLKSSLSKICKCLN